ncbi:MFS transporter [Nocardia neocaledoniensis]|uniref:MFS transporter n=1 Tax=Nocardia neocaledoniensis TaxID=236511 RepID=UPI0024563032|nr:MFS transporter [Nocardia neocaledoniensis]
MLTALMAVVGSLGAPLIVVVADTYDVSTATAQWTISLAYLTGAATMPVISWLASTRFRRPTTLVVVGLVCLGSVGGALDLGFEVLLIGRCLQGLGLGLVPVAIATARDALVGVRRSRAIASLSVTNIVAGGVAFALVGLLVDIGGPHLAYGIAALSTLATFFLVSWAMPRHVPDLVARPPDVVGTVLLATGGAGSLLALSQGARWGWLSPATIVVALVSVAAIAAWLVWLSGWSSHPFMNLRLARTPIPLAVYVTSFTVGTGMYIIIPLAIVLAQTPTDTGWGLGLSVAQAGLLILPYATASVLGSRLSGSFHGRVKPQIWLPVGCSIYALAAAVLLVWHAEWWQLFAAMAVAGLGGGLSVAQMPGLLVMSVPPEETGPAIGFALVIRLLGFSVGSALVGVVLSPHSDNAVPSTAILERGLVLNAGWWALAAVGAALLVAFHRTVANEAGDRPSSQDAT